MSEFWVRTTILSELLGGLADGLQIVSVPQAIPHAGSFWYLPVQLLASVFFCLVVLAVFPSELFGGFADGLWVACNYDHTLLQRSFTTTFTHNTELHAILGIRP